MVLAHHQKELKELANKNPPETRPEFTVKEFPTSCIEYLSTGLGDTDCGGKLKRLSKNVSRCPICGAVYIKT